MNWYQEDLGLSAVEYRAIHDYGLNQEQLGEAANLGNHTFDAMDILKKRYSSKSNQEIFSAVKELNAIQVSGLRYGLTEKDVQSKNFGAHTIWAMRVLKNKNPSDEYQDIFSKLEGYNEDQAIGYSEYDLTDDQVKALNYGRHIYIGMRDLIRQGIVSNNKDAIAEVEGFSKYEVGMVSVHGYKRKQVMDPDFRAKFMGKTFDANQFAQPRNSKLRHLSSMSSVYDRNDTDKKGRAKVPNRQKLNKGVSV